MPFSLLCEPSLCVAQYSINTHTHTGTVSLCLLGDRRAIGVILRLFRLLQLGSHSTPTYSGSARCHYQCATWSLHIGNHREMSLCPVKLFQYPREGGLSHRRPLQAWSHLQWASHLHPLSRRHNTTLHAWLAL